MVKPLNLPPSARRNRGDSTLAKLRRDLLVGRWEPGDRLPPERELAAKLGTNRNTLREALRTLESEHLLRARQGDGTIALDWRANGEVNLLPAFLTEDTPAHERLDAVTTLLGLRTRLLDEALTLAVTRASSEDHLEIERALEALRAMPFGARAVEADVALWRAMVLASHNLVLIWVFNTFARIFVELGRRFPMLWRTDAPYLKALDKLVDLLRRGRTDAAREQMRRIFDERSADVLQLLHGAADSRQLREWLGTTRTTGTGEPGGGTPRGRGGTGSPKRGSTPGSSRRRRKELR